MDLEKITAGGLLIVGLLPLVFLARRAATSRERLAIYTGGLAVAAAVLCFIFQARPAALANAQPADRPIAVRDQGYVSSQSCQSCHPSQYETWHSSFHRTMTQIANPPSVRGNFTHQTVETDGHVYRLEQRGDEFWVELDNTWSQSSGGEKPQREWQRISLITGSHYMQVYWFPTGQGRKLAQLPIVYLIAEKRWIPRVAAFLVPPSVSRVSEVGRFNDTCVECHTTRGQPRLFGPDKVDTHAAEFGIACEACHGPGETHVDANRQPLLRYAHHFSHEPEGTVVQPENIMPERASEICGQCHSVHTIDQEIWQTWKIKGSQFLPGEDLREHVVITQQTDPEAVKYWGAHDKSFLPNRFWSDGMIRVSGREFNGLIESPCYLKAHGDRQLTCLSCHTMHPTTADKRSRKEWTTFQLKPQMQSNQACLQCHEKIGQKLAEHTHHAPNSSGSSCYNCHMPFTTYGLLRAMRSHQVSSPEVQASVKTGRPNACNQCHLDKTMAWSADHLHDWYGIEKPGLTAEEKSVAASILWLLKGDAGQRALMAWSFGWKEAQAASGADWEAPHLVTLLNDPYDAVRLIAQRSLKELPGFEKIEYDFLAPLDKRNAAAGQAVQIWSQSKHSHEATQLSPLLLNPDWSLQQEPILRLLSERDNRDILLSE